MCIDHALCDLGSSVHLMPLSMCERFDLREMRPTTISLELVDHFVNCFVDVLEDIPIKEGDLYVLIGFVILEMEPNHS